jgi:alanine racemase
LREVVIDASAISRNIARLRTHLGTLHLMTVVKADGYGHGLVAAARAAVAGGADWLGVADVTEAMVLREAGLRVPILAWLHAPDADFAPAIAARVDIAVSTTAQLEAAARVGGSGSEAAVVQLALDTGLHRNGAPAETWQDLFRAAARLERAGRLNVRGMLSHVSNTSAADDRAQLAAFHAGVESAREAGLHPDLLHIAATAAALTLPETRLTMARVGIAAYGLSPFESDPEGVFEALALAPAMTLRAPVVAVRRVPAGTGVSYGYTWRAPRETNVALIPLGYADGIPRAASNRAAVTIGGVQYAQVGRVAMDQFIVEVGEGVPSVRVGDEATVFGDPQRGVIGVDAWARAADTINYEIVTRLGPRVRRTILGATA